MSTRCQVIVKDQHSEVWFYRHSDGYPEGVKPSLDKFLSWVKAGRIRNNAEQAAGWLVIIGNQEYAPIGSGYPEPVGKGHMGWKVGAYEPCAPERHGDIEFLHTVDLDALTITTEAV